MQAGRGRRYGSWMVREDSLVTFVVRGIVLARNIWRQRNMAESLDDFAQVAQCCQTNSAESVLAPAQHFGGQFSIAELHTLSHAHLSSRPDQGLPLVAGNLSGEQDFTLEDRNSRWGAPVVHQAFPTELLRRRPKSRAGITRALFTTISSSPRSASGRARNAESCQDWFLRSRTSIRDASRRSSGRWAIWSGGKLKLKSERRITARGDYRTIDGGNANQSFVFCISLL